MTQTQDPRIAGFLRWLNQNSVEVTEDQLKAFLAERIVNTDAPQTNDNRSYYRTVYLKTEHWRILKSEKLAQVKECEICKAKGPLDVHHRYYRNLYDVRLNDLAILCRKCHSSIHEPFAFVHMTQREREIAIDKEYLKRNWRLKLLTKLIGRLYKNARDIGRKYGPELGRQLRLRLTRIHQPEISS